MTLRISDRRIIVLLADDMGNFEQSPSPQPTIEAGSLSVVSPQHQSERLDRIAIRGAAFPEGLRTWKPLQNETNPKN